VQYRYVSSDGTAASEQRWSYGRDLSNNTGLGWHTPDGDTLYDFSNALNSKITRSSTEVTEKTWITGNNARLQSVKTTLNGMVKQSTFQYEQLQPCDLQYDYDWGVGAPGPELRSIHRQYLPTVNSTYANAASFGSLFTEEIYKPDNVTQLTGNVWYYDQFALTTRSGTIPGWADPGGTIRGNLTRAERVCFRPANWYWTEFTMTSWAIA